jgi:hypothetical protein
VKSKDKPGKPDDANAHGTKKTPGTGAKNGCGKPPWAGKGNHAKNTPAALAQRQAACGDNEADSTNKAPNAGASTTTTAP